MLAGSLPLGGGGESAPGLPGLWAIFDVPWLVDLCFHLLVVFSLCVCVSEAEFPLFIRAPVLLD